MLGDTVTSARKPEIAAPERREKTRWSAVSGFPCQIKHQNGVAGPPVSRALATMASARSGGCRLGVRELVVLTRRSHGSKPRGPGLLKNNREKLVSLIIYRYSEHKRFEKWPG
jgi:hypothetical protein